MIESDFQVELASWEADSAALMAVREAVFIVEQEVPREEEFDELDPTSVHVLARDADGRPVGTGRLTPEHKIGRMAVLTEWRGRGVGDALLRTLLEHAHARSYGEIELNAQVTAIKFYEKAGFEATGEEFLEAGIRHRTMRLALGPRETVVRALDRVRTTTEPKPLSAETLVEAQHCVDGLVADARHKLWIYTRDLDRFLFDREPLIEALKRVALSGRGAELRILVQESVGAVRDGNRLLHLATRIGSYIHMRTPVAEEDRNYPSAFVLNDQGGYFFRQLGSRYDGEGNAHAPGKHRALLEYFERVWERSEEDPELRRMPI